LDLHTHSETCTEVLMSIGERTHPEAVPESAPRHLAVQHVVRVREHKLVLTGELDMASAPYLAAAAARIDMSRNTFLVLDLRNLAFIDASGIRAILVTQELCAERECTFIVVPGEREQVQRLFEICGLLDHLPFRNDEALRFLER
jgi:anti-anti-sigma factor